MTAINPVSTATTGASSVSGALDKSEIASNFTTFLQLLTTQLKNQDPLSPLDTNQFTQQLVMFAQVEQQMKSNDQLTSLVSLEKSAAASTALAYVGANVVVDGATGQLANGSAKWNLNVTKPSTATVTIKDSPAKTPLPARSRSIRERSLSPGTAAATTAGFGRTAATRLRQRQLTPTISRSPFQPRCRPWSISVDLTQYPPQLPINGQNSTLDKIKRIVRPTA